MATASRRSTAPLPTQSPTYQFPPHDGAKSAKTNLHLFFVPTGCFFFVPACHVIGLTFYQTVNRRHKEDSLVETATCLVAPMPIKKHIDGAPSATKRAMLSWHTDATKEKKTQMWLDRTAFLKEILQTDE